MFVFSLLAEQYSPKLTAALAKYFNDRVRRDITHDSGSQIGPTPVELKAVQDVVDAVRIPESK